MAKVSTCSRRMWLLGGERGAAGGDEEKGEAWAGERSGDEVGLGGHLRGLSSAAGPAPLVQETFSLKESEGGMGRAGMGGGWSGELAGVGWGAWRRRGGEERGEEGEKEIRVGIE